MREILRLKNLFFFFFFLNSFFVLFFPGLDGLLINGRLGEKPDDTTNVDYLTLLKSSFRAGEDSKRKSGEDSSDSSSSSGSLEDLIGSDFGLRKRFVFCFCFVLFCFVFFCFLFFVFCFFVLFCYVFLFCFFSLFLSFLLSFLFSSSFF